jgi:two-component system OmpR family response regulator
MGWHILIIEAEDRFRKNLYTRLQSEGFKVDKVTPQDDVESIFSQEKIDAVLLGVDGLGREGLTLIKPIKAIRPETEIIIINDANHMDLSIEAMELGAFDDFLVPLDIESLVSRIKDAIELKNGKKSGITPFYNQ